MIVRFLLILIYFCSNIAHSQANIVNISHINTDLNNYKITFALDKQTSYEVLSLENQNRIAIDLYNSVFSLNSFAEKKLDGNFIKKIIKINKRDNDLRIVLELNSNAKLKRHYSTTNLNNQFVSIELKNDLLVKSKAKETKQKIIVIDPGHGGIDNGTKGTFLKTLEKNLVLSYARELKKELSKYPQYKVMMTREKDELVSKEKRRNKTREMKADLLISLHADYNSDASIRGASVYTLSQEALNEEKTNLSEEKNKLNILKNDKLIKENKNIANMLIDMVYKDTLNSSISLAKHTTNALSKKIHMLPKSHRSAGFKILKGVDIPGILIEIGYLSNPEEEKLLNDRIYKKKFVYALVQGINQYNKL